MRYELFRAGLVEAWGRGIEKVINECIVHGCPKPVFDYRESGLMVEFKANTTKTGTNEMRPVKRPEMRPEKISTTEQEILKILKNDPSVTTRILAEKLGVFKSTITRNIAKLKEQGIIRRIGSTKRGYWSITESPRTHDTILASYNDSPQGIDDFGSYFLLQ